jgi:thymidylate synthase
MNKLDLDYQNLLKDILENGVKKETRNGGTLSVFGRQIRHNMKDGFPLLTTKKMFFKGIVTELLWFLRGDTSIKYLLENDCNIWTGDAYKNFVKTVEQNRPEGYTREVLTQEEFIAEFKHNDEFAKQWGELGPIYGKQWRRWNNYKGDEIAPNGFEMWNEPIDQITNLINDLKTNPDSRRLMVNAWNVGELDQMVLPPCHYSFQVYTRELSDEERLSWMKQNRSNAVLPMRDPNVEFSMDEFFRPYNVPKRAISLMWNQRSVDTFLGLPFNIASYGLLLEIIAKEVNMVPDELIGNLGDTHLYSNHIEQAKEQIGRELSLEERADIFNKTHNPSGNIYTHNQYDENNIPTQTREPFELPKLGMDYRDGEYNKNLTDFIPDDFYLIDYQSHPSIKAPLSN